VPELVEELAKDLSSDNETPVLVRAAMAHLNLVMIHPFRDGNGRMSRCLQTLVLAREQILAPQFSSIEEYLGRNTQAYYRVLQQVGAETWRPQRDARPWIRFCLEAHFIQASSVLRRIQESEEIWTRLDILRTEKRLPPRMLSALFDATVGLKVRNASYRTALGMSDEEITKQAATDDLRAMVQAGLLERFGARRASFYQAGDQLKTIWAEVRKSRRAISAGSLFEITD
jgi:Fic family protein